MAGANSPEAARSAGGAAAWWGHHSAKLLIATIIGAIYLRIEPLPPGSMVSLLAPIAIMVLVVISWLLIRAHSRRLCEACMSAMPLNAAAVAARNTRRFQVTHLGSNRPLVLAYFAVLVASAFIPGTIGLVIWTAVQASMIYLVLSYSSHRMLQPWCPLCSDNGGGNWKDVETPDPVPQGYQPA